MIRELIRVPELRLGLLILGLLFARQALFGQAPASLKLRSEVVVGSQSQLADLFENPGLISGKALRLKLDLPPGYHYLDQDEVRYRLGKASPALAGLALEGDGVKVYARREEVRDPLAGRPPALPEAPRVESPVKGGDSRFVFLFTREWEGATFIPRGTPVILGREGGRMTLQLNGRLLRDLDFTAPIRVKLTHTGGIVEEPVSRGDLVFF